MRITVFVVDDHTLVRAGIVRLISLEEDLEVVGEGAGSADCLKQIKRLQPNVVIVDLEMPEIRGADLTEMIKDASSQIKVLVCSMHASYAYIAEALQAGADGFVLKSSPSASLLEGIRRVAHGHGHIDAGLQTEVIKLLQNPDHHLLSRELSTQETETLGFAAAGLSNQEIAQHTGQSVETVKLRLRRSFQKLGAADRASAVAVAMRRHLIE